MTATALTYVAIRLLNTLRRREFLSNDQDYSTECGQTEWQLGTHVRRVGGQDDESDQCRAAHGGEHTADG